MIGHGLEGAIVLCDGFVCAFARVGAWRIVTAGPSDRRSGRVVGRAAAVGRSRPSAGAGAGSADRRPDSSPGTNASPTKTRTAPHDYGSRRPPRRRHRHVSAEELLRDMTTLQRPALGVGGSDGSTNTATSRACASAVASRVPSAPERPRTSRSTRPAARGADRGDQPLDQEGQAPR